jgi:hypothetical protein
VYSKKERATQKSNFRDVHRSVEQEESPEFKLQFKNETVVFDTWSKIRQLEAFKIAIGEGLTVHFHNNPLVQECFEFSESFAKNANRRLFDTVVGKSRAKDRREMRVQKHEAY